MENILKFSFRRTASGQTGEAPSSLFWLSTMLLTAVNIRSLGTAWAVLMVALAVCILILGRSGMSSLLMRRPILILYPFLLPLSCVWSEERFISLSLGAQTLLSALTAVTIAHNLSRRQLLLAIFLAIGVTCLACIASGRQGPAAEGMVLVGFLGSKDAMGLLAYGGVMASTAVLFDVSYGRMIRGLAFVLALIELKIAVSVHAATAIVALGLGLAIYFGTFLVLARHKATRWVTYLFALLVAVSAALLATEVVQFMQDVVFHTFGKDPTLTGRTILWEKAIDLFLDSPFLGHGYRAFWVGSSRDTHAMLAKMGLTDGRGFHFHEQYLETLADTGVIGGFLLLTTLLTFTVKIWRAAMKLPSSFTAFSLAVFLIYFLRMPFETTYIPFSFDMMMIHMLATAAMKSTRVRNESGEKLKPWLSPGGGFLAEGRAVHRIDRTISLTKPLLIKPACE